jgi:hypothetical protein
MMKNERGFLSGKAKNSTNLSRIKLPLLCWVLALWLVAACAPKAAPPPPPESLYPSRVVTQDGMAYMVNGLRLPGTRQELTLRDDGARLWMDLKLIRSLSFSGPLQQGFRQAEIILVSGEKMQTEVYVNIIVEGETDLGYWNMSLSRIKRLDLGND